MKNVLRGKSIVITRNVIGNEPWIKYIKSCGGTVYSFPTIKIVPIEITPEIKKVLNNISEFDWVIFTSAAGIRSLMSLAEKEKIDISVEKMPHIAVVGDTTAETAKKFGYEVSFQPSTPSSAALGWEIKLKPKSSILLLRTTIAARDLPKLLSARGAEVTDIPIYKTAAFSDPDPKFSKLLEEEKIDILTFASPSSVRGFLKRVPKTLLNKARMLPAIAIGLSVSTALKKAGFKNIRVAKEPTIEGMVIAVGTAIV